jgi:hypothetical protein
VLARDDETAAFTLQCTIRAISRVPEKQVFFWRHATANFNAIFIFAAL